MRRTKVSNPSQPTNAAALHPRLAVSREDRTVLDRGPTEVSGRFWHAGIRCVLAPLDGSLRAEHALPHALAIARRTGAVLRIVHVHPHWDHVNPWSLLANPELAAGQDQCNYLLDVARRITRTNDVPVETILVNNNDAVGSLAKAAVGADLVVLASRRRAWWRRWWSQSAVDGLRQRLQIPLLCVPGHSAPVDLTGDPAPRQILVPLDGSREAERILAPAAAVGHRAGARLHLLNVQNHDWTSGTFEHTNPHGYLMGVAREVARRVPGVDAHVLTTEQPVAKAVSTFAQRQDVDLIALATRADGGLARWLRGSLVDSLLARTSVPVLLLGGAVKHARAALTTVVSASR